MPVSNATVVDGMGIEPTTGNLLLHTWEEREWRDPIAMLQDLERKVNSYLAFVRGEQIEDYPAFKGRKAEIQVFFQYHPRNLQMLFFENLQVISRHRTLLLPRFTGQRPIARLSCLRRQTHRRHQGCAR